MDREEWEEIEEKKEYLKGYRKAKQREQMLLEQIQQLRLDTMMPSINNDGMPHGSGGDNDLSDYLEKKEELEEELKKEQLAAVQTYQRIHRSLKQMEDKGCEESCRCCIAYFETAIEALEKQLPKRVDFEEDVAENMCVECPSCGSFLGYRVDCLDENYQIDNCKHCGQRLDWSE